MTKQQIEIRRKAGKPFKVDVSIKIVNELREVFSAASGNFFSGKYNMNDFSEFLTNEEVVDFFKCAEKFKSWGGLIRRVGEHPYLVYLLLYVTFIYTSEGKRTVDLPLILSTEASWVYKDVYKDFNDPAYLVTDAVYNKWIQGADLLGRPKKVFSGSTTELFLSSDKKLKKVLEKVCESGNYKEQSEIFSATLGFPKGYFDSAGGIYEILINNDDLGKSLDSGRKLAEVFGKYIPKGTELGANNCWIPGGRTEGGAPEIVIEGLPNTPKFIKSVKFLGKKHGLFVLPLKDVTSQHTFSARLHA